MTIQISIGQRRSYFKTDYASARWEASGIMRTEIRRNHRQIRPSATDTLHNHVLRIIDIAGEDAEVGALFAGALDPGELGLEAADQHTYENAWGVGDSAYWNGHGTSMAGVALYGDLETALGNGNAVDLHHRLETVKVLPPAGQNDPELYGAITEVGIDKAEAQAPRRRRVFCMAVTSEVGLGRGRPSSWSAAIDQLCYGSGDRRRLMVLAAGNLRGDIEVEEYLDRNDLEEVESPAQAWNALVAGAYTDKIGIAHPDYAGWEALAPAGELSPASRTSGILDRQWPIRPDVVFEDGNFAHDGVNAAGGTARQIHDRCEGP